MEATGYANWGGTWREGAGDVSTASATLDQVPYSYVSRFEGAPGANPVELLAAAEGGCFNQALANNFGMNSLAADRISTTVVVTIEQDERSRPSITSIHVTTEASVPGATETLFQHCAERARANCTIARLLKIDLTMTATLLS
jgi:osmotically inducible protein OsmC